eukprot:scpid19178/ scgid23394/ 
MDVNVQSVSDSVVLISLRDLFRRLGDEAAAAEVLLLHFAELLRSVARLAKLLTKLGMMELLRELPPSPASGWSFSLSTPNKASAVLLSCRSNDEPKSISIPSPASSNKINSTTRHTGCYYWLARCQNPTPINNNYWCVASIRVLLQFRFQPS